MIEEIFKPVYRACFLQGIAPVHVAASRPHHLRWALDDPENARESDNDLRSRALEIAAAEATGTELDYEPMDPSMMRFN